MKPRRNRRFALTNPLVLCLLMLVLTTPLPASAVLYEYTYTGNAFTDTWGPEPVTHPGPFPGPASDYNITVRFTYGEIDSSFTFFPPEDFTISDGRHTLRPCVEGGPGYAIWIFSLSSGGLPERWDIGPLPGAAGWGLYTRTGADGRVVTVEDGSDYAGGIDMGLGLYVPAGGVYEGRYEPGLWARTAVVPIPPSALLLGASLIPLAWARRKKRVGK